LRLRFLGAMGEVGRAAILVETREARILLDYGVKLSEPEPLGVDISLHFLINSINPDRLDLTLSLFHIEL